MKTGIEEMEFNMNEIVTELNAKAIINEAYLFAMQGAMLGFMDIVHPELVSQFEQELEERAKKLATDNFQKSSIAKAFSEEAFKQLLNK